MKLEGVGAISVRGVSPNERKGGQLQLGHDNIIKDGRVSGREKGRERTTQ
jgi:hypothetical protein